MKKIKIASAETETLTFTDGTCLESRHDPDCCEYNYADFSQVDDLAREWEFEHPLMFESCDGGFRFGNENKMVFVPCYSIQNGYYSYDVDILLNGKEVLSGVDCYDKSEEW